jgi:hypothetical protein
MPITREDFVTQSVDTYLRRLLKEKGYGDDVVEIIESYPHDRFKEEPLDKTYVTVGFSFDDGGKAAEMGSDLRRCLHTIEFFIFGKSAHWGKNVANAVKFCLDNDQVIPLLDITQPARPEIDALIVVSVPATRQPVNNPQPWQENIWTVLLRCEDVYSAEAAVT